MSKLTSPRVVGNCVGWAIFAELFVVASAAAATIVALIVIALVAALLFVVIVVAVSIPIVVFGRVFSASVFFLSLSISVTWSEMNFPLDD